MTFFLPYLVWFAKYFERTVEGIGYIGRIVSSTQAPNFTTMPYVIQSIFILLGPPLLAASVYMVLGRLITLLDAGHHSIIRPKWLTAIFVLGDVLSFFVQAGGGGIMSSSHTQSSYKTGENVIVVGLVIQILWFGVFVVATVLFNTRIQRSPTNQSRSLASPWQRLIYVLYATSALIMIRSIYRVVEYVTGSSGILQEKEVFLYVFDALPMALVTILFAVFHPSQVLGPKARADAEKFSTFSMADISTAA